MSTQSPKPRSGVFRTVTTFVRHWLTDLRLKQRRTRFRSTDVTTVAHAYGDMSAREFEDLNGPQSWLNERVIPRVLQGRTNGRPWRLVDLGCGSGGSSSLLLRSAPAGSTLVGYDLCGELVDRARRRAWRDSAGAPTSARFVTQSIVDPLSDPDGGPLPGGSVDLAHAAGIVGHHLREDDVRALAAELRRVLAPDGYAVLDAGPKMPPRDLARLMAEAGFRQVDCQRLVPWAKRAAIVFQRDDRNEAAPAQR